MKRMQKWISLLVTGAMLVSLFPAALAADEAGGAGPETMPVSIYHLSDGVEIHGVTYDSVYSASEIDGDWAQARAAGVEGYEYSGYDVIDYDDYAEVNLDYTLIPQAPDPVRALLELIAALPDAADVTLDDADIISAAVDAFNGLSYTEQQTLRRDHAGDFNRMVGASDALDALMTEQDV